MKFKIFTLFPDSIKSYLNSSIPSRAEKSGKVEYQFIDIRDYSMDKHKKVDDYEYGGDAGLLMKYEPLAKALTDNNSLEDLVVYMSPQGVKWSQNLAESFSTKYKSISIIAGHYKGIDKRIIDEFVDIEISIGDYILSGGELGAVVVIDSIVRLVDGVINNIESAEDDSISFEGLLDCDRFTKPYQINNRKVVDVLTYGKHEEKTAWQLKNRYNKTKNRRPDLFDGHLKDIIKEN